MKIKNHITMQRLVGKIDNDFNISEADWIPRVAAWAIDGLSQMNVLPMELKRRTLEVADRIATFPCVMNSKEIRVYDKHGVEIPKYNKDVSCGYNKSKNYSPQEIAVIDNTNKSGVNFMNVETVVNRNNRYFVLDGNSIELTFNTDEIIVESYEVATYYDDYYDCEVPYIYDNGLLLEALSWYVVFKYLSRGSKHPVYSLTSNNPVINPYSQWLALKPKAEISVKLSINKNRTDGWNNFFYNSTFLPKN